MLTKERKATARYIGWVVCRDDGQKQRIVARIPDEAAARAEARRLNAEAPASTLHWVEYWSTSSSLNASNVDEEGGQT